MTETSTTVLPVLTFHHVGIQTTNLASSLQWYEEYFGGHQTWSLLDFSDLTLSRLPGIRRLVEVIVGDVRLHLFERDGAPAARPEASVSGYQHVCFAATDPRDLDTLRQRWIELYDSGRYSFARDEQPTDIVTDEDGVQSFYAFDVNGIEFEFTYVPARVS